MAEMWAKRHPVISTAIATLLGSMFFKEPREFVSSFFIGTWGIISKCYQWITLDVSVPLWLLLILCFLSLYVVLRMVAVNFTRKKPDYYNYTEDNINGIVWRWSWSNHNVFDLRPFCPSCDMRLAYMKQDSWDKQPGTSFYCDNCEQIITNIRGGNLDYAHGVIMREIDRRVRKNLYKTPQDNKRV